MQASSRVIAIWWGSAPESKVPGCARVDVDGRG